jgi:hypothetical protein
MSIKQTEGALVMDGDHVYLFAFLALVKAVEFKARHGISLARNMPTVARLRAQFGITARTYADAAVQLRAMTPEPGDAEGLAKIVKLYKGE